MSELRRNEIVYEEGWHDAAPAADVEEKPVDEQEPQPEERREGSKPLLITIQLVLCLLLALALFLLKTMDSAVYRDFMSYYREELQKPIVSRGVFDDADLGRLFGGTDVTVQATPDEAQDR